jgi:hypothetical protein
VAGGTAAEEPQFPPGRPPRGRQPVAGRDDPGSRDLRSRPASARPLRPATGGTVRATRGHAATARAAARAQCRIAVVFVDDDDYPEKINRP